MLTLSPLQALFLNALPILPLPDFPYVLTYLLKVSRWGFLFHFPVEEREVRRDVTVLGSPRGAVVDFSPTTSLHQVGPER